MASYVMIMIVVLINVVILPRSEAFLFGRLNLEKDMEKRGVSCTAAKGYRHIKSVAEWCNINCNDVTGFCPAKYCDCDLI